MSLILNLLMFWGVANAQDPAHCPYIVERYEGTQIQQLWADGSQSCFLSVSPLDAYVDLIYRDHLFSTDGLFMVFNSYGPGPESETTGAREFYMFPRPLNKFEFRWNRDAQELEVIHVTGDKFIFDARKARLKSISRTTVTVADYVEKGNRGGIEISNFPGLLLDGGFNIGSAPTGSSSGNSVIKDARGQSCKLQNHELFKYTSDGDVILRYSDNTLASFLQKRCSNLQLP